MKSLLLFLLFVISGCRSNDDKIKCSLVDYKRPSMSCGIHSIWWGVKFKDQKYCEELVGYIQCPNPDDSTFFLPGRVYYLTVSEEKLDGKDGLIINNYEKEKLKEYKVEQCRIDSGSVSTCQ